MYNHTNRMLPTLNNGMVAKSPWELSHPSDWEGLEFAWFPHLTGGGTKVIDAGPHGRDAHFVGGLAVSHWVNGPYGRCVDLSNGSASAEESVHCWQWGPSGSVWNTEATGHYIANFDRITIIAAQMSKDVDGNSNGIYGRTRNIPSGDETPISLCANDNDAESNRHGTFQGIDGAFTGSGSSATGSVDNKWRIVGGRWASDFKPELWTNGILREKRSSATANPSGSANNSVHAGGAYRHTTGSRSCNGYLGPVLVWSRALDDRVFGDIQADIARVIRKVA